MVPESSPGKRSVRHQSGNVDSLIKSDYFPCAYWFFASSCPLAVLWGLWGSGQRQTVPPRSGPACSEWLVSLSSSDPSNHQLLWQCHHQTILETDLAGRSWGSGRRGTAGPTSARQVYDFDFTGVELPRHGGGGWCGMKLTRDWRTVYLGLLYIHFINILVSTIHRPTQMLKYDGVTSQ